MLKEKQKMTKLIKTNLLKKYNQNSDIAQITASTFDYHRYRFNNATEGKSIFHTIGALLFTFYQQFELLVLLIAQLTGGLIFYPVSALQHRALKRRVINEFKEQNKTIDDINKLAKELEEKYNNKN